MTTALFLLVLLSAASHAGWNFIAKSGPGDALSRSAAILLGAGAIGAPALLFTGLPAQDSFIFAAASAAVHAAYMLLVGLVYRGADMSAAYPIIRGGSLILTATFAAVLFGDHLSRPGWAAVMIVAAGVIAMAIQAVGTKGIDRRTLALAFLAALSVTVYTLVDGAGVRLSGNPVGYVMAMVSATAFAVLLALLIARPRALTGMPPALLVRGLAGGALFNLSYGAALYAMTQAPIGLVAAVRETSILFGALFAVFLLRERMGPWRWTAAAVIVAGLVLSRLTQG